MTARLDRPLPAEWAEPPASERQLNESFGRLAPTRRPHVAARAYDIYLSGRVPIASCWARALGESRMRTRRDYPW